MKIRVATLAALIAPAAATGVGEFREGRSRAAAAAVRDVAPLRGESDEGKCPDPISYNPVPARIAVLPCDGAGKAVWQKFSSDGRDGECNVRGSREALDPTSIKQGVSLVECAQSCAKSANNVSFDYSPFDWTLHKHECRCFAVSATGLGPQMLRECWKKLASVDESGSPSGAAAAAAQIAALRGERKDVEAEEGAAPADKLEYEVENAALKTENAAFKAENEALEAENEALEAENAALKAAMAAAQ